MLHPATHVLEPIWGPEMIREQFSRQLQIVFSYAQNPHILTLEYLTPHSIYFGLSGRTLSAGAPLISPRWGGGWFLQSELFVWVENQSTCSQPVPTSRHLAGPIHLDRLVQQVPRGYAGQPDQRKKTRPLAGCSWPNPKSSKGEIARQGKVLSLKRRKHLDPTTHKNGTLPHTKEAAFPFIRVA